MHKPLALATTRNKHNRRLELESDKNVHIELAMELLGTLLSMRHDQVSREHHLR